jgi:hypothetical protein
MKQLDILILIEYFILLMKLIFLRCEKHNCFFKKSPFHSKIHTKTFLGVVV